MTLEASPYVGPAAGLLVALWVGVAVLGGTLSFYALRSGRRTGDRSMVLLGVGFAILALGTTVEWFGVWATWDDLLEASLGCTALMLSGFAVILYALKMRLG
ncbi:MAG: DUF7521 family protein [Thermoplasmata archaeon]